MANKIINNNDYIYMTKLDVGHQDKFIQAVNASANLHEPFIFAPNSEDAFISYISKTCFDRYYSFLFCDITSDELVGVINLNEVVRGGYLNASLGYYAFHPYAGKGYMNQAMRMVIDYALRDVGLHRLEANIQPSNMRSIELVKKLGFERSGYFRDFLFINGAWQDHECWVKILY